MYSNGRPLGGGEEKKMMMMLILVEDHIGYIETLFHN
jgi:hypothetical protein